MEKTCFHHGLQDLKRVLRVKQNVKKLVYDLGIAPFTVSKATQIFTNNSSSVMVKMSLGARRLPEEPHQKSWFFLYPFRFHKVKMLVFQQKRTGQDSPAQVESAKSFLGFFKSFQKKGGRPANSRSIAIVQTHESFNDGIFGACHAAHSPGNLFLLGE